MSAASTSLASQRYSELADEHVCLDVLEFNARSHYALLPELAHALRLTHLSDGRLSGMVYRESSVASTGALIPLPPSAEAEGVLWRAPSVACFSGAPLGFQLVLSLLARTLVAQPTQAGVARMSYPSGGALYPAMAFVCKTSEAIADWPGQQSAFQVLPFSRSLEGLGIQTAPEEMLAALSGDSARTLGQPAFAIVFAIHLDRCVFKYRHRGFRLAQLEVGSMYQRVAEQAQAMGISSRVWAGFSDFRVAALLGLDASHLLPMVVQFLGHEGDTC